ncbi:MlaC/ttg2D family ABC transporter substrate-binding protein [Niveispirillum sp. KHB5.9]|uniref:MlaC/ttg2D family ABC transporter substrate-binding protein n=1 Tax=Niveispirillum sp. KHB5.9 TaxID=3400269 RepID=UPI003A856189
MTKQTPHRRSPLAGTALLMLAGVAAIAAPTLAPATALAQNVKGPQAAAGFVQSLGDKAIATLADPKVSKDQAKAVFRDLLNQNFDINTISRFVLGKYWNVASDAQKKEYQTLFEQMIVEVYAERFSQYAGEKFKVGSGQASGENDAIVASQVLRPGGQPPVNVSWRVRSKDGSYKIIDVIVENVSMSVTQRSEFASLIESNGGRFEALLNALRERTQAPQATQ